jgi:ABC-2 type transport system ATP-binding protein
VVGGRTIRVTLPGAAPDALRMLSGVTAVELHGDAIRLACSDSDAALRALLAAEPAARDIEVGGADLEDAFVALTSPASSSSSISTGASA